MLKKIVVGVDGLQGGQDAIALARALGPKAELVLACAYGFDATTSRFALLGYGNALRDTTEKEIKRARTDAGVPDARIELLATGSPARALHRLAETEHADLIVIGSAHHGRLGRALLGDVSRAALHGAPCPVAIAPRGYRTAPVGRIGVAFNDSPEAREALRCAARLAADHDARLLVRTAVEVPNALSTVGGYSISVPELLESLRSDAQQDIEDALAGLGIEADAAAVTGTVPETLDELSGETDLVVTGSRCWGPIRRVALGSTSDRLIHRATSPVLVVPRTAIAHDADAASTGPVAAAAD
jgi:nucleotide-binding universal stress UspA family protein